MNITMETFTSAASAVGNAVGPVLKAGAAEYAKTVVQCTAVLTVTVAFWGGVYYVAKNANVWSEKSDAKKAADAAKEAALAAKVREAMNEGFDPNAKAA